MLSDRGPPAAQQAHTAYLKAVDQVLNTLAEKQAEQRKTLGAADTQPEQIEATQGLANAYDVDRRRPGGAQAAGRRRRTPHAARHARQPGAGRNTAR